MNRLLNLAALSLLTSLVACEEPTTPENIVVDGTADSFTITWDGPAENIAISQGADWFWNISLEDPPEECVNGLDGGVGVTYNVLPEGYVNLTQTGEPQVAPDTLDDGEYSLGVASCVAVEDTSSRSFQNSGISFSVVEGVVVMPEE